MEEKIPRIVKKFLTGQTFEIDGFVYKFLKIKTSISKSEIGFNFWVNVDLPNKNQSYVAPKFDEDIYKILKNLWGYFDMSFSYTIERIYVNGKESNGIYVTPQKLKDIQTKINHEYTRLYVYSNDFSINFKSYFKLTDYYLTDVNMTFVFDISISNIESDGKSLQPKMVTINDLASALWDDLNDNDNLRSDGEDIVYSILEPEFKVGDMDNLYYSVYFNIDKIDGIPVEPDSYGGYINREYFT